MVAWHEVPGKVVPKRSVPEGRCDWRLLRMRRIFATSVSSRFEGPRTHSHHACNTRSYPPRRGRVTICRNSRHFVPGYHRFVPPGQKSSDFQQSPRFQPLSIMLLRRNHYPRRLISTGSNANRRNHSRTDPRIPPFARHHRGDPREPGDESQPQLSSLPK